MIHSSRSMSAINAAHAAPATPPRRPHSNTVTERPMSTAHPTTPSKMLISSPPHSPRQIQNHLYQMFLAGQTADVAVIVRGSWEALYNLHRVILIQSVSLLQPAPVAELIVVRTTFERSLPTAFASRNPIAPRRQPTSSSFISTTQTSPAQVSPLCPVWYRLLTPSTAFE